MVRAASVSVEQLDPKAVKKLRVYPPLGIARIGNCFDAGAPFADDYLVSTETIGGLPTRPDGVAARSREDFRDAQGSIRRHAARFRAYAEMLDGTVQEVTLDNVAAIEWRVSLANLKAGWYEFNQAMDLPGGLAKDAPRRNATLPIFDSTAGRSFLDIVPLPRSISGRSLVGPHYQFIDGLFCGQNVYLGELRTDADGRLLVLGGRGVSASYPPRRRPVTFANNEGWHDDVSDGPVRALVRFHDEAQTTVEAEPGYVAVTPPNFAPGLVGLVTMDDAVRETFAAQGWIPRPATTAFTVDVYPLFARLSGLQWINHGLYMLHGRGGPLDVSDPAILAKLRDKTPAGQSWRASVFELFRTQDDALKADKGQLPQVFSDAEGEIDAPSACLAVTATQIAHLQRWAAGDFADDWPGSPPQPTDFAALDAAEQVRQLERAALHDCLGGPFHPGIELTWTMRLPQIWAGPYRLKVLLGDGPARQDWGDTLTPQACIAANGPYDGVAAGALTRFLGVPWQTDGASCNSQADYYPSYFLSMPTFWGARVPDQVLAAESYARMGPNVAHSRALQADKHFNTRVDWLRDVRGLGYLDRISLMIAEWQELGMVLPAPAPVNGYPADMRIEQGRAERAVKGDVKPGLVAALEAAGAPHVDAAAVPPGLMRHAVAPPPGKPKRRYRQGEI